MSGPELAALRAERDLLARRLTQGLVEQAALADLREAKERLQLIDSVLLENTVPHVDRWQGLRRHGLALLGVAALVSLAALVPMPRVAFALELKAGAAQLQMAGAGSLASQTIDGELHADGFARAESADAALMQRARDNGVSPLALRAERLQLRRIGWGAGARLDIEAGTPAVRLVIDGAPSSAEIEFGGAVSSSFGGAPREQASVDIAEWLKLGSDQGAAELQLARKADRVFSWRGLQPQALRFVERQAGADGQVRLQSSLHSGLLRLPATERELRLAPGSGLELDGLQLDQAELVLGDELTLKVSGSARSLRADSGGFSRSLAPSWLEYAAHNHGLGLLWSAGVLLWGLSTWLRKQFGDKV